MKLFLVFALVVATVGAIDFLGSRVNNGHDAGRYEATFIVALRTYHVFCGGSILNAYWVLTAAHCLIYSRFDVLAGMWKLTDYSFIQFRPIMNKDELFPHEQYSPNTLENDIALIFIKDPFDFTSPMVSAISLPSGQVEPTGDCTMYGWGETNVSKSAKILQALQLTLIDYQTCLDKFPEQKKIHPENVCSNTPDKSDGCCKGDSGGPLVQQKPTGLELTGVISRCTKPCNAINRRSVYVSTSYYADWIKDTMKKKNTDNTLN